MFAELLKKYPDAEILEIGPAINLATVVMQNPELVRGRKCTIMAGCYGKITLDEKVGPQEIAEWNVLVDPDAADVVFSSEMEINMIGIDVTLDCPLDLKTEKQIRSKSEFSVLDKTFYEWRKDFEPDKPSILYDPVAVGAVIDEEMFTFEKHKLKVNRSGKNEGVLSETDDGKQINVAVKLDKEIFYKDFISAMLDK